MPDISLEQAARTLPSDKSAELSRAAVNRDRTIEADQKTATERTERTEKTQRAEKPEKAEKTETTELSREETLEVAALLQSSVERSNRNLEFSVDDTSGRTVVTVRDSGTDEVIRQIPSEEALRLASDISSKGASILDTRA